MNKLSITYFGLWLLGATFASATSSAHPHAGEDLDTKITNVQYCIRDGRGYVEADLLLENQDKVVATPLTWSYSLCFTSSETGRDSCVAGGSISLSKLEKGIVRRHIRLQPRSDLTTAFLPDGKVDKEAMARLKPKIGTSVGSSLAETLHQKDQYLDPKADYSCKN